MEACGGTGSDYPLLDRSVEGTKDSKCHCIAQKENNRRVPCFAATAGAIRIQHFQLIHTIGNAGYHALAGVLVVHRGLEL